MVMKELTIEEKAKAYDEAIKRAKQMFSEKEVNYLFPELKESKDEKMKKIISDILLIDSDDIREILESNDVIMQDIDVWLEKKGEKFQYWKPSEEQLEALDYAYNSCPDTERGNYYEGILETLIDDLHKLSEKQGEQNPAMIQWKGNNLKEVIDFTGKAPQFDKWFKTFDEYEQYVHEHNNIFKLFYEDGSHYEVPVGAWIVRTPDGYNVASKAVYKQKSAWSEEDEYYLNSCITKIEIDIQNWDGHGKTMIDADKEIISWLKSLKERYTLKPSEEQMKALSIAMCGVDDPLFSLYQDLLKLKG